MDNRLLSEREVLQALKLTYKDDIDQMFLIGHCMLSNATQLTKTDKEWVEWVTTVHAECRCGVCPQYGHDCVLFTPNCIKWQERKKEIGIESTT